MTIEGLPTTSAFHIDSLADLEQQFEARGVAVLRLDGSEVADRASMLRRFAIDVDLDQAEVSPPQSWNALNDVMWSVLAAQHNSWVALVWTHVEVIMQQSLNDLLTTIAVFTAVADSAQSKSVGAGPIKFQLFLLGDGTMFPPFVPPV